MGIFTGGTLGDWSKKATQIARDTNKTYRQMQYTADTIRKGPKGTTGMIWDKIYGGTVKDIVEGAQGKTDDPILDPVAPPLLASGEVDANANLQAYQQNRKNKFGRMESNLSQGTGSSILTS
tara:strand:+ start:555 stop:920 length:366 start_codon:yes stop_codon:yes gene_type:complete